MLILDRVTTGNQVRKPTTDEGSKFMVARDCALELFNERLDEAEEARKCGNTELAEKLEKEANDFINRRSKMEEEFLRGDMKEVYSMLSVFRNEHFKEH